MNADNPDTLQQRKRESTARLNHLRDIARKDTRTSEGISQSPHSLKAIEYGVQHLQLEKLARSLPDTLWFATLTFPDHALVRDLPDSAGLIRRVVTPPPRDREAAEDVLRKHLYAMNKWLFGRTFTKRDGDWLSVVSCFELTPIARSPHFHLVLEHPIRNPRAERFRSEFIRRWCIRTGAEALAQDMVLESRGTERALAYIAKHTVLMRESATFGDGGPCLGEFDAVNSRYEPRR